MILLFEKMPFVQDLFHDKKALVEISAGAFWFSDIWRN